VSADETYNCVLGVSSGCQTKLIEKEIDKTEKNLKSLSQTICHCEGNHWLKYYLVVNGLECNSIMFTVQRSTAWTASNVI
jgi:hypothetical protein